MNNLKQMRDAILEQGSVAYINKVDWELIDRILYGFNKQQIVCFCTPVFFESVFNFLNSHNDNQSNTATFTKDDSVMNFISEGGFSRGTNEIHFIQKPNLTGSIFLTEESLTNPSKGFVVFQEGEDSCG